jgi:hypothetical protein
MNIIGNQRKNQDVKTNYSYPHSTRRKGYQMEMRKMIKIPQWMKTLISQKLLKLEKGMRIKFQLVQLQTLSINKKEKPANSKIVPFTNLADIDEDAELKEASKGDENWKVKSENYDSANISQIYKLEESINLEENEPFTKKEE